MIRDHSCTKPNANDNVHRKVIMNCIQW